MNIFDIENDLSAAIAEIEDNGGEITPELEAKLVITEDKFKAKLESYHHIISLIKSEVNCIETEINRLKTLSDSKSKVIKKLEGIMLNAVLQFGSPDKKGIYRYDTGTLQLSTRKSQSVINTDEELIDSTGYAIKDAMSFMKYYNDGTYSYYTKDDLVKAIKNCCYNSEDEKYNSVEDVKLEADDLDDIIVSINVNVPASTLTSEEGTNLLHSVANYVDSADVKAKLNKSSLKEKLKVEGQHSNLGIIETNYSLKIK